jgi:hypothetical protein
MVFQKLQAWQDEHGVSNDELGRRVGCHHTAISRGKRGLRVLGMDLQLALQKVTKIPPSEWADFYAQTVHLRGESARRSSQKKSLAHVEGAL